MKRYMWIYEEGINASFEYLESKFNASEDDMTYVPDSFKF